jgi:hypothetical protein
VSFDGNVMTFTGGAMNGWHATSTRPRRGRICMKDPTAIETQLRLGDPSMERP